VPRAKSRGGRYKEVIGATSEGARRSVFPLLSRGWAPQEGHALDIEVAQRGNSAYLPISRLWSQAVH
jgi:hypothetical protein